MYLKGIILLLGIFTSGLSFGQYNILRWYEGKSAAVSITFDGDFEGQINYGLPILKDNDFRATYFITAENANWKLLKKVIKADQEIGSRSYNGYNLVKLSTEEIEKEILKNLQAIQRIYPKVKCESFAYPFGVGSSVSAEDQRVRNAVSKFHISARGFGRAGGYIGEYKNFDAYNENKKKEYDNYYYQIGSFGIQPSLKLKDFESILDDVNKEHGWFVPLYHSIEEKGLARIPAETFALQMAALKSRQEDLWVAPFAQVSKYIQERDAAKLVEISETEKEWKFRMYDDLPNETFDQPLTIQLRIPDGTIVKSIKQGGQKVDFLLGYKVVQFSVVPDAGDIILEKEPPPIEEVTGSVN